MYIRSHTPTYLCISVASASRLFSESIHSEPLGYDCQCYMWFTTIQKRYYYYYYYLVLFYNLLIMDLVRSNLERMHTVTESTLGNTCKNCIALRRPLSAYSPLYWGHCVDTLWGKTGKPDLPDTELGIVVDKCFNNRSLSNIINNFWYWTVVKTLLNKCQVLYPVDTAFMFYIVSSIKINWVWSCK